MGEIAVEYFMHAITSRMYLTVAAAVVGVWGGGDDLGIGSASGVYSPALHQCQRRLHFEEQLHCHYRLIN